MFDIPITSEYNKIIENKVKTIEETIKQLTLLDRIINKKYSAKYIIYNKITNKKYNIVSLRLRNNLFVPVKNKLLSLKEIERYKKSHKLLLNYSSIDDKVDMAINNPDIKKDDRRQNVKINDYHTEGYNLFRLELSLFLEKNPDIKNKIIKIVRDKDTKKKNKKRGII